MPPARRHRIPAGDPRQPLSSEAGNAAAQYLVANTQQFRKTERFGGVASCVLIPFSLTILTEKLSN
jgi:hypothetical protein